MMASAAVPLASTAAQQYEPAPSPQAASPSTAPASPSPAASSASQPSSPPEATAIVASIQSAAPGAGTRSGARKKTPPRAETVAQVLQRIEPEIRAGARRFEVPEDPTTVQLRSAPGSGVIDSVRVLRMSSQHPFAACAVAIIRRAALPSNADPVEDFTFFKARGPAAK